MKKTFAPNFKTPLEEQSGAESIKRNSNGMRGDLHDDFRSEAADVSHETESLAKSYGIYLEFNRAKSGKEKDWMYMIRLGIPGGGPITPEQWQVIDDLSERWGRDPQDNSTLRLTTRQNIQFHWVKKEGLVDIIKTSAESGLLSLNGCGDNVRNVMACPLSAYSEVYNANELAYKVAKYFQLPVQPFIQIFAIDPDAVPEEQSSFQYGPQLLNRKFKMAFSAIHLDERGQAQLDNCVELRTHDLGVAPIYENGRVERFQIFIGGGQGEKNGKPTASVLARPLAIVTEAQLMPALDAVVAVHQEWGDRANRHWARLKYVVRKQGIPWFRDQVEQRLGYALALPIEDLDVGPRDLHHGWTRLPSNGLYAYGAFIENGRLTDHGPNGRLKSMIREISQKYATPLLLTANQDIIFAEIAADQRDAFEADLATYGFGRRNGVAFSALRLQSGACVGRDTCRLAYTDSEQFEPELIDQLEELGWGDLSTAIGITGCERQCFRPATKAIGLIGSGMNRYQFKILGTEDGRHQGVPLTVDDQVYLRSVPRDQVPVVIDTLFHYYNAEREERESFGYFMRRKGIEAVVSHLKAHPKTSSLLVKPARSMALT